MDTLIRQIAKSFENNGQTDRSAALDLAMKEIVFSGLNRCGFFKTFVYLPECDRRENGTFYTCFLHCEKGGDFGLDAYLPYIGDELNAMGIPALPVKTKDGFQISFTPESGAEKISFEVFIRHKELREPGIRISYHQVPLPYEYRWADGLKGTVLSEIQKALESVIKAENTAEKKKNGPQKARKEKKKAEKPKDDWIQPSLFDF